MDTAVNGGLNTGIPFSRISGTITMTGDDATTRTFNDTTVDALEALELAVITAVNEALDTADDTLGTAATSGIDLGPGPTIAHPDLVAPTTDTVNDMTADEASIVTDAKARIAAITGAPLYTNPGANAGGDDHVITDLIAEVATANTAIARLENVVGVVNGTTGSVNSFYGSMADISVKVVFRSLAAKGIDSNRDGAVTGTEERSTLMVVRHPSKTNGEASVEAVIEDANGTPLAGFVDFTIEGDASVVFKASSLKTHRVSLTGGTTKPVDVKGLSKTDPVRIKVTANYNGGELEPGSVPVAHWATPWRSTPRPTPARPMKTTWTS